MTQPALDSNRFHQDLHSHTHRPEELKNSPNSSREFSLPTAHLRRSPLRFSGDRVSQNRETRKHSSREIRNPEPQWVKCQRSHAYRGFPFRDITTRDVNNLSLQSPRSDVSIPRYNDTCIPLSSRVPRCHTTFRISQIVNPRCKVFLMSKTPNAESRPSEIVCHLSCGDQRLRIPR
jgi:hypothetical protein